jgi:hypothetical protein
MAAAREQGKAQFALQRLHTLAHGSGREMLLACRIRDGAGVHHGDQAPEIARFQKLSFGIAKKSTLSLLKSLC